MDWIAPARFAPPPASAPGKTPTPPARSRAGLPGRMTHSARQVTGRRFRQVGSGQWTTRGTRSAKIFDRVLLLLGRKPSASNTLPSAQGARVQNFATPRSLATACHFMPRSATKGWRVRGFACDGERNQRHFVTTHDIPFPALKSRATITASLQRRHEARAAVQNCHYLARAR
jgi:hypothetical protein